MIIKKILKDSPVHLNKAGLSKILKKRFIGFDDPRKILNQSELSREEFSKAISSFQSGITWKTTQPRRHPLSDEAIQEIASANPGISILDIGVSDGSTSLDLIEKLGRNFSSYYITDVHFFVVAKTVGSTTFFYYPSTKECFFIASNKFIIHKNTRSKFFLLNWFAQHYFSKAPSYIDENIDFVPLYQPELQQLIEEDSRLKILEWDIFQPWKGEKVDLIKVANVLNRVYFSDDKILLALSHICQSLKDGGNLVITENRQEEQWTIFRKENGRFKFAKEGNGGCDIKQLIEAFINNNQ